MGMYTKYKLDVELKAETPVVLLNYIRWLTNHLDAFHNNNVPELPNHPAVENYRHSLVMCNFDDEMPYDEYPRELTQLENGNYRLQAAGNLKNYPEGTDWQPIQGFLDMILPHISDPVGSVIGWYEYEEWHKSCNIVYQGDKYSPLRIALDADAIDYY